MADSEMVELPSGKQIVIEFKGGFRDGELLQHNEALMLWFVTNGLPLGKSIRGPSTATMESLKVDADGKVTCDGPGTSHCYKVVERIDSDDELKVVFEFQEVE